jgi:hypothetical protein
MGTNPQATGRRAGASIAICLGLMLIFWFAGGLYWLQTSVFPPRRPSFMPRNSVWIDAPPLPISWHHGWWFGCTGSAGASSNHCKLVKADGEEIYGGDYLPCAGGLPIPEEKLNLIPPPGNNDMWLFGEGNDGVVGFLKNGDILLPVGLAAECDKVKARFHHTVRNTGI